MKYNENNVKLNGKTYIDPKHEIEDDHKFT